MDGKRIPKRILESNIIGKRPIGKRRKRRVNAVEIENTELLKVRNWKRGSLDRQVWRRHLKEVKAPIRAVVPQKKQEEEEEKKKKKKKKNKKETRRFITVLT
jgi:hypothetical protein